MKTRDMDRINAEDWVNDPNYPEFRWAPGCPFCKIMRDGKTVEPSLNIGIVEPIHPVVPGHMIVIPMEHVRTAGEKPWVTAEVMRVASQYAASLGCDYNLITSAGKHATQTVEHLHIHVVPRREGDGLLLPWSNQEAA